MTTPLPSRPLGRAGPIVPCLGFGAFKIGRSQGAKYPGSYGVPEEAKAARILGAALDLGLRLIDTAPAYGSSEERIGRHLAARRREFVLCTKAGERFDEHGSVHDFSPEGLRRSARASVERLGGPVDLLLVHADARDAALARDPGIVAAMRALREEGVAHRIGFSGKGPAGNAAALEWADAIMVEYHLLDRSAEAVLAEARARGVGTIVKKALASGRLPAEEALSFVLANDDVDCVVVGGLSEAHLARNAEIAKAARGRGSGG